MHEFLLTIGILCIVISLLILLLKNFNQPYLIAYAFAGILLGPFVFGVIHEPHEIETIGEVGILLHMFFLGMELQWPRDARFMWKPVSFQVLKSGTCLAGAFAGVYFLELSLTTALVLAFVLMLNSTSVASEYLKRNKTLSSTLGVLVLSVLIIQDIAFSPLLNTLSLLGDEPAGAFEIVRTLVVTILVTWLIIRVNEVEHFTLPGEKTIKNDRDLQLFVGLMFCFGLSILSSTIGLSASLGAFASGILIKKFRAFDWIEHTMHPFRTFFMAIFFVYLGLLFDLDFFKTHLSLVFILLIFLIVFQSLMSALCFRILGYNWRCSFYSGALLSNVGELSLVICLLAFQMKLIDEEILKLTISVSILSILFTTIWTGVIKRFIYPNPLHSTPG